MNDFFVFYIDVEQLKFRLEATDMAKEMEV